MAKVRSQGAKRRCSRCQKFKARSDFPRNASMADGLAAYCRLCKRAADRSRRSPAAAPDSSAGEGQFLTRGKRAKPREAELVEAAPPPKKLPGRKSTITAELTAEVCATLSRGHSRRVAARRAGIDEDLLAQWMHRGREAQPGAPTRKFYEAVLAAEGEGIGVLEDAVLNGAAIDPQLALRTLERRAFEEWGRREHVSLSKAEDKPMETVDVRQLIADRLNKLLPAIAEAPPGPAPAAEPAAAPGAPGQPA